MTASSRGAYAVLPILRPSPRVCTRCARGQFRAPARAYSGAAAATIETPVQPPPSSAIVTEPEASTRSLYRIKSGIILTRAPLLTRPLTPFENSFFFYQKRLNERLSLPFITSVYFKPDTPGLIDWNLKVKDREGTVGKEIGVYNGKSSKAWEDEVQVGDSLPKQETVLQSLLKDAEMRVSDDAELIPEADRVPVEQPQPRETEADRTGDVTKLDRKLDRTLYLVVKANDGKWGFPSGSLGTDDNLHEVAKKVLDDTAGVNMNTWIIGRAPVAHYVNKPVLKEDGSLESRGEKIFFLKGRIMAGQADLTGNPMGYTEFKWLTREELQAELAPEYYHSVRNMMADR